MDMKNGMNMMKMVIKYIIKILMVMRDGGIMMKIIIQFIIKILMDLSIGNGTIIMVM